MNYSVQSFFAGQYEGIIIILISLSEEEGYEDLTKEYVINRLTKLNLTEHIEPIISVFFTSK